MKPRRLSREAPELALLHVLLTDLDTLEALLLSEHPSLLEPGARPATTLRRALFLHAAVASLRREIIGYRRAILRVLRPRRIYLLRAWKKPPHSS